MNMPRRCLGPRHARANAKEYQTWQSHQEMRPTQTQAPQAPSLANIQCGVPPVPCGIKSQDRKRTRKTNFALKGGGGTRADGYANPAREKQRRTINIMPKYQLQHTSLLYSPVENIPEQAWVTRSRHASRRAAAKAASKARAHCQPGQWDCNYRIVSPTGVILRAALEMWDVG